MSVIIRFALDAKTLQPFATKWWDDGTGNLTQIVEDSKQLPSGVAPVTGAFPIAGMSAALAPIAGRGFNVALWPQFQGYVALERSFDNGSTWLPIDNYVQGPLTKVVEEPESGVLYRLNCLTADPSQTINYRLSQ